MSTISLRYFDRKFTEFVQNAFILQITARLVPFTDCVPSYPLLHRTKSGADVTVVEQDAVEAQAIFG